MRSVPFQTVLWWVAGKMLGDPSRMRETEAADFTRYINQYVRNGWERDNWPEWTYCQERWYRPFFVTGTTYAEGDEVFNPWSQEYIRFHTDQDLGQSDVWEDDPKTFQVLPNAGIALPTVGDKISWNAGVDSGIVTAIEGRQDLALITLDTDYTGGLATVTVLYSGSERESLSSTAFDRYIGLDQAGQTAIGTVLRMSPLNPDENPGTPRYRYTLSPNGVQVPALAANSVWLQFRTRPPTFTSVKFDIGTLYTEGQTVYYPATGDCYTRTAEPDAEGDVPISALPTSTAHWTLVPFPYVLVDYVQRAAYAEALDSDGQPDKSARQADLAEEALSMAWSQSEGQQDQVRSYAVEVRTSSTRRTYRACY